MADRSLEGFAGVNVRPPTESEFNAVAAKQQREFGATAEQAFSQTMGLAAHRYQMKVREERERIAMMDVQPWSVVSVMPFPLNVNGVLHSRLRGPDGNQVPACEPGQDFAHLVIWNTEFSIRDEGVDAENIDNYTPVPCYPKQLAQEFTKEFLDKMQMGGIIIYQGAHPPTSSAEIRILEDAKKASIKYLQRLFVDAETKWGAGNGELRNQVGVNHRKAAQVLRLKGFIKKDPVWLIVEFNPDTAPAACPGCGSIPENPSVPICKNCPYVFKPLDAYMNTLIRYDDANMDRLNAEEWKTANKEKARRDKSRAAGAVKEKDEKE